MSGDANVIRMESAGAALRDSFLRWQCRLRQMIMREQMGRPDEGVAPEATPHGAEAPIGRIITVLSKKPTASKVMEMRHMARRTQDPAQRRESALRFFSEMYYQNALEFSDMMTATFAPGAATAEALESARRCVLTFDRYAQRYDLRCRVWRLGEHNPLWQATYWHNALFNPNLPADLVILGFEPDWSDSTAEPSPV